MIELYVKYINWKVHRQVEIYWGPPWYLYYIFRRNIYEIIFTMHVPL